jgi:hypothetical protein
MKKYLFILLFLGALIQKPFAQTFNWVDSATRFNLMAGYYQPGCKVSIDDSDNVYATGYSNSSFSLRKYNSNGVLEWTNSTSDYHAVATDAWGNCYVTGSPYGGSFFEKYSSNGTGIHNYLAGGPNGTSVIGNAISYDGGKYFYITGSWGNGTAVLGSQTISVSNHDGAPDLFILKCDTAGNVLWARTSISGESPGECCGLGINAAPNGLIYVTGYFADSVLFHLKKPPAWQVVMY